MPADQTAPRFPTDSAGARTAVALDLAEYRRLTEAAEELADLRAFDEAKAEADADGDFLPLEEAFAEIDRERSLHRTGG